MPRKYSSTLAVIDMIAAERIRQIEAEGFDRNHDDRHTDGVLARAGACYAMNAGMAASYEERHGIRMLAQDYVRSPMPADWPWALAWWKPKTQMQDLVRAAALLVAEIERQIRRDGAIRNTPDRPPQPDTAAVSTLNGGTAFASPPDARLVQPIAPRGPRLLDYQPSGQPRAVIEGEPGDRRAAIAECCARAGLPCTMLPARGMTDAVQVTLIGVLAPEVLSRVFADLAALADVELHDRRVLKDRGDPAETATIRPRSAGKGMPRPAVAVPEAV